MPPIRRSLLPITKTLSNVVGVRPIINILPNDFAFWIEHLQPCFPA
jgi:hypothetical protein